MLKEFRDFIARGNVIDLAVAVVIGAAFGRIVSSLVDGVIMPPLGLVLGRVDFSSLFVLLNDVIAFLIIAIAVFMIVKQVNRLKRPAPAAAAVATKECPFCASSIAAKATRCPHCTSAL
jgi:large conductance mechanosensitive channel